MNPARTAAGSGPGSGEGLLRGGGVRIGVGEVTGALADLGVLVPLATALILVNGLDAGAVLVGAGLLVVGAGLVFRVPFPVQPLKALTAIAVAQQLDPTVIFAAGIELGSILLLLSIRGAADAVARLFVKPVIRSLQLGVGILLVIAAAKLVISPPEVFTGVPRAPWVAVLAIATIGVLGWAERGGRNWLALAVIGLGIAATVIVARPALGPPSFDLPSIGLPPASAFGTAVLLLVVPQIPLTFGNAVVAVTDLSREYFGPAAHRVTNARVCLTDGIGNVVTGVIGGMPMCHGAGGLTAHVKLGARTAGMNLVLGGMLLGLGIFFSTQVLEILGLLPVWALAGFLAFAGLQHAWLVRDLRGVDLGIAVAAGGAGVLVGNLALTAGLALAAAHALTFLNRRGEHA